MGDSKKKERKEYDQRTAKLTPEEQEMRRENLEARGWMNSSGARQLCATVCLAAICDYNKIRKKLGALETSWANTKERYIPQSVKTKIEDYKEELEDLGDFFESEMFMHFSGMSGREETIRYITKDPRSYMGKFERRNA